MTKTLINLEKLFDNYTNPNWVLVDCHFQLDDPNAGFLAFQSGHIPGARYANLDKDLSGRVSPGKTGRHPLPNITAFASTLSAWGIDNQTHVVAYDNRGGAIAARLWWLLNWLGHQNVSVLDGCFDHWCQAGFPVTNALPQPTRKTFYPSPNHQLIATVREIEEIQDHPEKILIDSRAPDRFRGENETLDPIAGHIPGARNHYFLENLDHNNNMIPKPELQAKFLKLIADTRSENVIFYCGSGVTAAQNALAMAHAGLGFSRIYPGSWSEWITDPEHKISTT